MWVSFKVRFSVSVKVRVRLSVRFSVRVRLRLRVRIRVCVRVRVRVRKKRICMNFMKCFCVKHTFLSEVITLVLDIYQRIVRNENSLPFLCRSFTL